MKTVVLGAGIAGLSYAYHYKDVEKIEVYEKKDYYGGLCHSFKINGYTFDSAVHLSFTENSVAREIFDKTEYMTHVPVIYNYYNGHWMKHPVINNTYCLSSEEKTECMESFFGRQQQEVLNYDDWLRASYGDVFTDKFYNIYTKKYWTVDAKEMSTSWTGVRFAKADAKKILLGSYESNDRNDYYAKEMRYPCGGNGYQQFLEPLRQVANVNLEMEAMELDIDKQQVTFSNGTCKKYDKLVSSIPLPELIKITKNVPKEIVEASERLKASKVSIISVGFNKPDIAKYLWFYIYDTDIMAARVNSPSMKCKDNVPEGCSSLQFEIYHHPDELIDEDEIIANVKYSLQKMNICKEEDIEFMDYRLLPYGNVIFTLGMEKHRDIVKEYYEKKGIKLIGRFGKWDYLWSDQSLLSVL